MKYLFHIFISIAVTASLSYAQTPRQEIRETSLLPNNDTLVVTRSNGDFWFGLAGALNYDIYSGSHYIPYNPGVPIGPFNPEFKATGDPAMGYGAGLALEYNPAGAEWAGGVNIFILDKRMMNTSTGVVEEDNKTVLNVESAQNYLHIAPVVRYNFGLPGLFATAGPFLEFNLSSEARHLLRFENSGAIANVKKYDMQNVNMRFGAALAIGYEFLVLDINKGNRVRMAPFVGVNFGNSIFGTQPGSAGEQNLNRVNVRIGFTLKLGRDNKEYDTLRFDPSYRAPEVEIAELRNNGVRFSGFVKETLIASAEIEYIPLIVETIKEEPIFTTKNEVTAQDEEEKIVPISINKMETFRFNSSSSITLSDDLKVYLNSLAKYMQEHPGAEVRIAGHSDNLGTSEENQRISERRAERVVRYLTSKGIKRGRLFDKGMGDRSPIGDIRTESGRVKNRRVEIIVIE